MTNDALAPLVDLLKALAHPVRLRILALLRRDELCVCQITQVLGLPLSTASEHLTELRRAGLLAERREGRWVFYRLGPVAGLEDLVAVLWPHLEGAGQVVADLEAARAVRQVPVGVTCARTGPPRVPPRTRKVSRHAE
jgi:ArsR family transcriptional regulator, arsenate/arsenite/antimonite-responsive transcriptional repressor